MPADLTMLLFEVNQLICRLVRGDIEASEELQRKAGALNTFSMGVGVPWSGADQSAPTSPDR